MHKIQVLLKLALVKSSMDTGSLSMSKKINNSLKLRYEATVNLYSRSMSNNLLVHMTLIDVWAVNEWDMK